MRRYLNCYYAFIRQGISQNLQYRSNFFVSTLVQLLWASTRLLFYGITFKHIVVVGQWNFEKAFMLASIFTVSQAVQKCLFEINLMQFPRKLYNGELDNILLKPLSAQFIVSLRIFSVVVFIRLLLSIIIFIGSLVIIGWDFSWFFLIQFLWSMLISTSILYALSFIGVTSAFWVGNATNLYFLPRSFTGLTFLPMDIFPTVINELITFIIPLVFIATIPAQVLFEPSLTVLLFGTILAGGFLYLTHLVWNLGLKSYGSVSS